MKSIKKGYYISMKPLLESLSDNELAALRLYIIDLASNNEAFGNYESLSSDLQMLIFISSFYSGDDINEEKFSINDQINVIDKFEDYCDLKRIESEN